MTSIRFFGAAVAAIFVATIGLAGVAGAVPVRQVDWNDAFARNPVFTVVTDSRTTGGQPRIDATLGNYVAAALGVTSPVADPLALPECQVGGDLPCVLHGWPVLGRILYGDLDGDGRDEAVIPLVRPRAGPGAESVPAGLLIFREGTDQPVFVTAGFGYWWGPWVENNRLIIGTPGFNGDDQLVSNTYLWWRLDGDNLVQAGQLIPPCNGWGGDCPYFGE